jgi:hypothetical protein
MALRLRRGTEAERLLITPQQGEIIYVTDTKKIYSGDGATIGGILVGPIDASVVNDTTPQLGGDLDLNGRNIVGDGNININGNITATGTINLGDGAEDNINVSGLINSSLTPAIDDSYNLGAIDKQWANVWATQVNVDTTLAVGSQIIKLSGGTSDSSLVLWDAESDTLSVSSVIATTIEGNLTGSVFSDTSATLVDGVAGLIVGDVRNQQVVTNDIIINGPLGGITILTEGTELDDYTLFKIESYHNETNTAANFYVRGRGEIGLPAPVQAGDNIIDNIYAAVSADGTTGGAAIIKVGTDEDGTIGNGITPGAITLITFDDTGSPVTGLRLNRNGEISVANNTVVAGSQPGEADISSVATYLKINIGGVEYAIPAYSINPPL